MSYDRGKKNHHRRQIRHRVSDNIRHLDRGLLPKIQRSSRSNPIDSMEEQHLNVPEELQLLDFRASGAHARGSLGALREDFVEVNCGLAVDIIRW